MNLYLDRYSDTEEALLMLYIPLNGAFAKVSTGIKIHRKHCLMKGRQRVEKIKKQYVEYREITASLNKLTTFINQYLIENNTKNDLSVSNLKLAIKEFKNPNSAPRIKDIYYWLERYETEFIGKELDIKYGKPVTPSTRKVYHCFIHTVKRVLTNIESKNLKDWHTEIFMSRLNQYLLSHGTKPVTRKLYMNRYKAFLRWVMEHGGIQERAVKSIPVKSDLPPMFALTDDEISRIFKLEISPNSPLDVARNKFLVQIYTGVRHTDLSKISDSTIDLQKKIIKLQTQKTDKYVVIPVPPILEQLLTKKKYNSPVWRCETQRYNKYIRELAKMAELDSLVTVYSYKKGYKEVLQVKKYELISSHTARRTFITNSLRRGIQDRLVMQVTGHSTMESFQRYVKFAEEDVMNAFMEAYKDEEKN